MSDIPVSAKRFPRRFDPARLLELAFALALLVILGVVIVGLVPISHPRLTHIVVALIKRSGADSCTIGKVNVTLWKGATLHDVAIAGTLDGNHRFRVQARSITLQSNLLLVGYNRKKIISLIAARCPGGGTRGNADRLASIRCLVRAIAESNYIKTLSVSKASIAVSERGKPFLKSTAIDFAVSKSPSEPNFFQGSYSADSVALVGATAISQVSGEFSSKNGLLDIPWCKGKAFDGKVKLEARVDLNHDAVSAASLVLSGFDINKLYRLFDTTSGSLAGKADLKLSLDSSALRCDSLRGKGTLTASHLEVEKFAFQQSLVNMLAYPGLARVRFKKFKGDFVIKPGLVIDNSVQGSGDSLDVKASGWVRPDGQLNEKLEIGIPKASVRGLPPFAQKTLEETPSGGRVIRFKLYGLISNPKFEIENTVIIQKAVQNMFDDVKNNLEKWLR